MPTFPFSEILDGLPTIAIIDIGALPGEDVVYRPLMQRGLARILGFQTDEDARKALAEAARGLHRYRAEVIGDGGPARYHVCEDPAWSCICEPDTKLIAKFQNLKSPMRVREIRDVETIPLDKVPEAAGVDFLKVTAKGVGAELLAAGGAALARTLAVHIHIALVTLYRGQPGFAEVDTALAAHGFRFHKFAGLGGRTLKPLVAGGNPNAPLSQFLWADAVYVRDFMDFDALEAEALLKLTIILHELYSAYDLAALALKHHDRKTESELWPRYIRRLTGEPAPTG
ncbi:MAG: hypothetical protein ACTSUD_02980 [Alphaproteobacteria bacterium]